MSNILKGLNEGRSYGRDSWDSNMPGYQGDYGGAENFGRRNREWDEDDRIDARIRAEYEKKKEYEQNGKFWLKLKDSQRHLPAGPFTGKQAANTAAIELLKQQPELKGNLLITAYGPDETQSVAEGLSKRDQQDVAAIRAAIERLQAQSSHPNADKAAIQQSIEHERKRLALYGVAEGTSTTWEVSYDYGPHMTKTVTVKAGSEDEARAKVEKAAEKKGMSIMINSVEQGVAEGGVVKSIKRGMAGWGAFDKDKPADVVKRVKGQDTDTLKGLSNRGSTGKGSPAELQQKAISRELKKRGEQGVAEEQLDELSPQTLASYKKKAGADATQADKRGDYARGDKRMSGIIKATKKEFDNDAKGVAEEKQRLDPKCWKGYKKQGTKMKGDTRVNNCVPVKKESAIMKGLVDEDSQGDK